MDVALVEDAEDQVHHHQRRHDQQRHGAERLLERLRGALEARVQRGRRAEIGHRLLHGVGRLPEGDALGEIETDGDGRNWPWWLIESDAYGHVGPGRERRQRHLLAGQGDLT